MRFEATILKRLAQWRDRMRAFRLPLLIAAITVFLVGSWWSFLDLGISPADLRGGPVAGLALIAPLTLLYGGVSLNLLARSAGISIPLGKATVTSSYATLAEALPLPGGAVVRAGALMAAGASLSQSSLLVTLTAVLWIALAAFGAGLALLESGTGNALPLVLLGAIGSCGMLIWLIEQAGWRLAALTLFHRICGLALIAARLHLAFLALGVTYPILKGLPFALAIVAGSAASVAPAGLGISEALAALIAPTVAVMPAAAFLAVGIDRLLCFIASGAFAILIWTGWADSVRQSGSNR